MIIRKNACPCAYCAYFNPIEYLENNKILQKGFCIKKREFKELGDILCEDFILNKGIYTKKWYPKK